MSRPTKRQKTGDLAEEMICPISLQLPLDPVTAEDGFVYERESIEQYFEGKTGPQVKSPLSRQNIGKKLLPAPQTRSTLERLIQEGVFTGDLAQTWKDKTKHKKRKEELVKRAEEGDTEAMINIASRYSRGGEYFKKDGEMSLFWLKKAHAAGSVEGTAILGSMLVMGTGVVKHYVKGVAYLGIASSASDYAAYVLGLGFLHGRYGLEVDKEEACRLLELALSGKCTHQHMPPDWQENCKKKLVQLQNS